MGIRGQLDIGFEPDVLPKFGWQATDVRGDCRVFFKSFFLLLVVFSLETRDLKMGSSTKELQDIFQESVFLGMGNEPNESFSGCFNDWKRAFEREAR